MVMQYEEGYDLRRHLDRQKPYRLNENELKRLLMPLLDGLEAVHNLNYLHRDIKPSNIYLTGGHKPLLLDFGAARQMVVSRSRPVEQILTPPYGAIEQYGQASPQGPFTDIYAIGVFFSRRCCPGKGFPMRLTASAGTRLYQCRSVCEGRSIRESSSPQLIGRLNFGR